MKVVIIGGVAGGASAAARIRRLDEKADITIFEKTGYVSYANCGLPYYVGGVITDKSELTLQTPKSFWRRFRINVKTRHEVMSINADEKTVTVTDLESGVTFEEPYDKLVLAPGAKPVRPPFPGIENEKIFSLRTVEDTFRIHDFIENTQPKSAVLVGGGYIGIEMAENLRERGLDVTVIQKIDQLMDTLDFDMASFVHNKVREKGIKLLLNSNVVGFEDDGDRIRTVIEGAEPVSADFVLMAIGVAPDSTLAKQAGMELGIRGSILVNDRMETSIPDIYAVGDAVQVRHLVSGQDTLISLAGPANRQGRIAADNICGGDSHYQGSLGSSVIKIFDMTVAGTGMTEKTAKAAGLDYEKIVLAPVSHASYYPNAKAMTLKVLFEKNTLRILGAQALGADGVEKRIDVIATAIKAGMKADELQDLDLTYAPPFSSAKDPVNMAGFMIDNLCDGRVKQFHWDEVADLPRDGSVILLDTRTPSEYAGGHADGFVNIPVDELRERLGEIETGKPVYVMCQSGLRSYIACRILEQEGFDCYNFSGGYRFYSTVVLEKYLGDSSYPCGIIK